MDPKLIEHAHCRLFDDAFDALSVPARFEASAGELVLTVEFLEGFDYGQIYAPAGSDFICFEPMTAPTNALNSGAGLRVVRPGKRHRAAFAISVFGRGRNERGRSATNVP